MSDNADASDRWRELQRAAIACGIDPSTLPSPETMDARTKAQEPPRPIELKLRPLNKRQLAALRKAMPPSSKWLTKIPVDEFIQAVRFLAAVDFAWSAVPLGSASSTAALVGRYKRCQKAGVFAAAFQIVEGSPGLFGYDERELFRALAADERRHLERVELHKQSQLKKVSGRRVFSDSRST